MKHEIIQLFDAERVIKHSHEHFPGTPVIKVLAKGPLGKTRPFQNTAIAFAGTHARGTLLSVVDAVCAMGVQPASMAFGVKPYYYPEKERVCKDLIARGCMVEQLDNMEASLLPFMERQILEGRQILICDDGGYGSTFCARHPTIGRNVVGTVEQTTRGVWTLERLQRDSGYAPNYPVLALPHSELKKRFECVTVGEKVVDALATHRGQPVHDLDIAVLGGAGTIGGAIADAAVRRGARVKAFDPAPKHNYWQLVEHGRINVVDTKVEALVEADVVIGATGTEVLGVKDLRYLKDGVVLASASSGTYEFPLALLEQVADAVTPHHTVGFHEPNGTTYRMPWGRSITVLDGGRPINLGVAAGPEAPCFDLIMALIVAGLAELAAGNYRGRVGILDVFDEIAIRYRLPELYVVLHQEDAR